MKIKTLAVLSASLAVMGCATGGDVLCSRTVKDLVVGSGITFADRGTHVLKGEPFAVPQPPSFSPVVKAADTTGVTQGSPFQVGTLTVHPFSISHDAQDPAGFTIGVNGSRVGIATDHRDARPCGPGDQRHRLLQFSRMLLARCRIGRAQVDGHGALLRPACRGSACTSCRCRRDRGRCARPWAPRRPA